MIFQVGTLISEDNFNGLLHQQGRVLLDRDWNEEARIINYREDTAAKDIIGSFVAAIPSDFPDAFKILAAKVDNSKVKLTIGSGRAWVNGILVNINGSSIVNRIAQYLLPPIQ